MMPEYDATQNGIMKKRAHENGPSRANARSEVSSPLPRVSAHIAYALVFNVAPTIVQMPIALQTTAGITSVRKCVHIATKNQKSHTCMPQHIR